MTRKHPGGHETARRIAARNAELRRTLKRWKSGAGAGIGTVTLIRRTVVRKRMVCHIWTGGDTLCRLASTGGLTLSKYEPATRLGRGTLCQLCETRAEETAIDLGAIMATRDAEGATV